MASSAMPMPTAGPSTVLGDEQASRLHRPCQQKTTLAVPPALRCGPVGGGRRGPGGLPSLRYVNAFIRLRCAPELRLSRRLERDTTERGRSRDDVLRQFHDQVEPAHQAFVSPSQIHADLVIDQTEYITNMTRVVESVVALVNSGA